MDDCYYFLYSNCAKGVSCPFRHCEEAKESDMMCSQYENGQCTNQLCTKRHSNFHLEKNRKVIPCYWETHGGCSKPLCSFKHEGRTNDENHGKDELQAVKVSQTRVFQKPSVHAIQTPVIDTSTKTPNDLFHAKQLREARFNILKIPDEAANRPEKEGGKESFQPNSVNFKVKSLDEIRKEKSLKKASPTLNVADVEPQFERKRNDSSATPMFQDSPVKSLDHILKEKRAKRFDSTPLSTTNTIIVGTPAKNISPSKHDVPLSTFANVSEPASPTLPLLNRKTAANLPTSVCIVSDHEKALATSQAHSVKRIKIDTSIPLAISTHPTGKMSSAYLPYDFEELERDLDLRVDTLPTVYNEEDLDKQLEEIENMFS